MGEESPALTGLRCGERLSRPRVPHVAFPMGRPLGRPLLRPRLRGPSTGVGSRGDLVAVGVAGPPKKQDQHQQRGCGPEHCARTPAYGEVDSQATNGDGGRRSYDKEPAAVCQRIGRTRTIQSALRWWTPEEIDGRGRVAVGNGDEDPLELDALSHVVWIVQLIHDDGVYPSCHEPITCMFGFLEFSKQPNANRIHHRRAGPVNDTGRTADTWGTHFVPLTVRIRSVRHLSTPHIHQSNAVPIGVDAFPVATNSHAMGGMSRRPFLRPHPAVESPTACPVDSHRSVALT